MIVVSLMGGLGNQMFQYAAGRALSIRWGEPLVLDVSWYSRDFESLDLTPRVLAITEFSLGPHTLVNQAIASARLDRIRARVRGRLVVADHRCAPARFARLPRLGHTHLVGYWQDRRYFEEIAGTLRDEFRLKELGGEAEAMGHELQARPAIGVHVRRGDYVSRSSAAQRHGAQEVDYYIEGITHVRSTVGPLPVYVFSDEPAWCRTELASVPDAVVVSGTMSDVEELTLLSMCAHHVLSHSSFSWWGAWLGHHDAQVVVVPRRWTTDGSGPQAPPSHWDLR